MMHHHTNGRIEGLRRTSLCAIVAALAVATTAAADEGDGILIGSGVTQEFGTGCGEQTLELANNSRPSAGNQNFALLVDGAVERGVVGLVLGASNETWLGRALPYDLGALGFAGCTLGVSLDALMVQAALGGTAVFAAPIPDDANLIGATIHVQAFTITAARHQLSMSSALTIVIGA